MRPDFTVRSDSARQTAQIASSLASFLAPGSNIILTGDLGAGKTTFTKALAKALGIDTIVTSPSFVLLKEYKGALLLYHLDLYRLHDLGEIQELGLEDLYGAGGVVVVEWGDRLASLLPDDYMEIKIIDIKGDNRKFLVSSNGKNSTEIAKKWQSVLKETK